MPHAARPGERAAAGAAPRCSCRSCAPASGMVDAALRLIPQAEVGFVGPGPQRGDVPAACPTWPSCPTASTAGPCSSSTRCWPPAARSSYTCRLLSTRGAPQPITVVCVLAAPEGLSGCQGPGIDLRVVTAAIDSHLNEQAYIVPGLGDAGDRQFGLW